MPNFFRMHSGFSSHLFQKVTPRLPEIFNHPFNVKLRQGTLSWEKEFRPFVQQDALYLPVFSWVLQRIARDCKQAEHARLFQQFSHDMLRTEGHLHRKYLKEERSVCSPLPAVNAYIEDLNKIGDHAPLEIKVASIWPCFFLYNKLGKNILATSGYSSENEFDLWIKSYASNRFSNATDSVTKMLLTLGDKANGPMQEEMIKVALQSIDHECALWSSVCDVPTVKMLCRLG